MTFKVETVKWSWADPVQSKSVYRDDEFVCTKTREEALQSIEWLMGQSKGLTYTITVLRDGSYYTYWRHTMPCLGGLVKYRDSHGAGHFMNPYFPRDIRVAYPEGETVFVACLRVGTKGQAIFDSTYYRFILSEESPWVSAFGSKETIIFKDNYFVLTNMNTDPTVFYSLMRLGGFAHHGAYGGTSATSKWNPKAEILATKTAMADPRRLAGQKPIRISGGTWAQGFGYTRPYNESIFKTSLPHKVSEFGKLAGYPQALYVPTYFHSEMQSKFGIDVSKGIKLDENINKILTEAWDYFKEQSKELDTTEEKNLQRWRESEEPLRWVRSYWRWSHNDWLGLLDHLKASSYWPMEPDSIGQVLEELKKSGEERAAA